MPEARFIASLTRCDELDFECFLDRAACHQRAAAHRDETGHRVMVIETMATSYEGIRSRDETANRAVPANSGVGSSNAVTGGGGGGGASQSLSHATESSVSYDIGGSGGGEAQPLGPAGH